MAGSVFLTVVYLLMILFAVVVWPVLWAWPASLGTLRAVMVVVVGGGAGLICGALAATAGIPVQRWLLRAHQRRVFNSDS